jgi:hypothetical protein
MKTCTKCNKSKELSEFGKDKCVASGVRAECKECMSARLRQKYLSKADEKKQYQIEYRKTHPRDKNRDREYYLANKDKWRTPAARQRKFISRLRNYGLTIEDYNTIISSQNNCCAMCKKEKPLCIDHHHVSGKVRGLLCRACNLVIGNVYENPAILLAGIEYLLRYKI